jgi:hypothetical protein
MKVWSSQIRRSARPLQAPLALEQRTEGSDWQTSVQGSPAQYDDCGVVLS